MTLWDVAGLPREVEGLTEELAHAWTTVRAYGYGRALAARGVEAVCEALAAGPRALLERIDEWRDMDMLRRLT